MIECKSSMKQLVLILFVFIGFAVSGREPADYDVLSERAERYFKYKEWGSALAIYQMMIVDRPEAVEPYYKAIAAGAMLGDGEVQMDMFERTQQHGVSLDSLFNGVRKVSFTMGTAKAYEEFLLLVKDRQPWLSRNVCIYLLDYYMYRNDSQNVKEITQELLEHTPDNVEYLKCFANACMQLGDFENMEIYFKRVLEIDSHDEDALVALGNYYAGMLLGQIEPDSIKYNREQLARLSLETLSKACNMNASPYLTSLMARVNAAIASQP